MSKQKQQLLVATCREIPDGLNVRCCGTCAVSCLNFRKVPELYGLLGPMQWMWCTRDSSRRLHECRQLYGTRSAGPVLHRSRDAGPSHRARAYSSVSSGALSQAGPFHSYPPTPKTPQIPQQIFVPFVFQSLLLACFSFKETSVQMSYLELGWSTHLLCLTSKSCE